MTKKAKTTKASLESEKAFEKSLLKSNREIENGEYGTLDDLYAIHQRTIKKEAGKDVYL